MNRNRKKRFGLMCVAIVVATLAPHWKAPAQGTLTIVTFDGPPSFQSGDLVQQYSELGVLFTAMQREDGYSGFNRLLSGRWPDYPNNGTAYIGGSPFAPIGVILATGGVFGLFSVDLAENGRTVPNAQTVSFVGYRPDGSSVINTFTTDGVIGVPGTPDFQTFYFGPEFSGGLTRVEIPIGSFGLDNLVVIPEPSTWALLLVGGGILGVRYFKRKKVSS